MAGTPRGMAIDYKQHPVLYVDDEHPNLVVFRYAMEENFTVLTASNGETALRILEQQYVAVLIADQRMPGMHGTVLCERARVAQPDTQRILITAYADIYAAIDAINKGQVSRYLVKPWQNEELIDVLQTAIEFVHLQQAMRDMELRLLRTGQTRIATAVHDELLHEISNPLGALTISLIDASELIEGAIAQLERGGAAALAGVRRGLLELREAHGDAMAAMDQLSALTTRMRAIPGHGRAPGDSDAARAIDATARIIRREVERVAKLEVVLERSPHVRVEAAALGQIVLNLVLNAAQALEGAGTLDGSIRVILDATDDMAVMSVIDNGPGIEPSDLERVFQPYFTTKSTGTGLGLSIVREMVRRAGGRITAHSTPGRQTCFEVQLPLAEPS